MSLVQHGRKSRLVRVWNACRKEMVNGIEGCQKIELNVPSVKRGKVSSSSVMLWINPLLPSLSFRQHVVHHTVHWYL